jgi:hypothetical protein|nr:CD1871A family CXXC motif-containing protein [uncultured Oscillibacter sp.]
MKSALKTREKAIPVLRAGGLGLALLLIGIGLFRQEHLEVLQKAVRICLECIGIG